jgi:hydroxysqualene dehydroxylase
VVDRVAIVGAGYAGMAAAVTLAGEGVPVTVFESGPVPGGRARRIRISSHGQGHELDNGQHVLIGAYTELFRLMRRVGVPSAALLRMPLELKYAGGCQFRSLWLPAPLGLLAGLLLAKGIPFPERVGAVRFMRSLRKSGFRLARDITVAQLLEQHGQRGSVGKFLWEPLCVSALNTPVNEASAKVFLAVLRDTLAGETEASDLLLPRCDLSTLFPEPAAEFVRRHGGEIWLRSTVTDVHELKQGFDAVVVAVGPHQLKALLPGLALDYSYQPIYTCYLQYGARVALPLPMLGLYGALVQWVFDRGALLGERGRLACVISAQGAHQEMSLEELCERCHAELAQAIPGLGKPLWSRAIAEKRATISCTPDLARPSIDTPYGGVVLAGDYTDPEYPPTLEAAVRSGVRAAARVQEQFRACPASSGFTAAR